MNVVLKISNQAVDAMPPLAANILSYYFGSITPAADSIPANAASRRRLKWILATYWHPQLASLTAYSIGAKRLLTAGVFLRYSICASLCWSVFWALSIYHFGFLANIASNLFFLFVLYVSAWLLFEIIRWNRERLT